MASALADSEVPSYSTQTRLSLQQLSSYLISKMSIPLPLVAVLAIAGYLLWKILRAYVVRSPLDNLPGPPPKSLLTGMC